MIGTTLDITQTYLQQLRQRDHNVLYTETVRFGNAFAEVRHNLKELQTQNEKLVEESEAAASFLEQLQSTADKDRKEWEAFAQTMYDEVGKARAEKNVLQRDFEQQSLQLQAKEQALSVQVASLKEAILISNKDAEAKIQQLEIRLGMANTQYDETIANQCTLAAERDTAVLNYKIALQSQQDAKAAQKAAEEAAEAAKQLALSAKQARDTALQESRQALDREQAAIKAQQQADLAAKEAEEQARQAKEAQHDAQGRLARSNSDLKDVGAELNNMRAQLTTANKIVQTATKQAADLQKQLSSTQAQLKAVDKAREEAVDACKAANKAHEAANQEATDRHEELQAQVQLLQEQLQEAKKGQQRAEKQVCVIKQEFADKAAQAEREAADKVTEAERKAADKGIQAEKQAADKVAQAESEVAEKLAQAEREAADKAAAAEKAASRKAAAAEKAAADRVTEAEKEAADKVAEAEREAADKVAAAERAAAQKAAAAEKAAAHKAAAAEKAAADRAAAAEKTGANKVAEAERQAAKAARAEREAIKQLAAVRKEAAQQARQEAEEKANKAIEELQGEVEVIKLRLEQQEATEKRLRSRLNKQDAISTMRKEALVAAQQRNFELEGLLDEAQTKIGCAAKHRKSAQQQLDAQEQDFEKLGQRLKAASESPAASLPTISPRRISRRDVDLGLSPAAPEGSPSPNSLPYQASPDHPDLMEEDGLMEHEQEDVEDELSSGADTPEAQTVQPARGISSWMARSVGRLIPFSTSKATKPESVRKQHSGVAQSHHSVPVLSPAAVVLTQGKCATPTVPGRSSRGKIVCTPVAILQTPSGPGASAAGSKRKAEELQQDGRLEEALQKSLAEYQEVVHRPPTEEDGPPVKMRSPTRKRHRLALSSSPKADTAIAAAGDLAAEAVLQAAAAAKTPEEAVAAAEQAAKVVKDAAAEAVGVHASPPARGGKTNKAENTEENEGSGGAPTDKHARQLSAATSRPSTQAQRPPASPAKPTAATSPLEVATAVALPEDANTVVTLTARKRGRPSKADLALRRQMEEEQLAAASAAAAITAAEAPRPSTATKTTSSRASGSKGKKQAAATGAAHKADMPAAKAELQPAPHKAQAETDSKSAPSDLRKQPNAVTSTAKSTGTKSAGTSLQRPHTAEVSSAVSSGTPRRTSGRLASRSGAGGSPAAGPARSTRSKSHSTASGLAALEDTASKQPQPMTPIAEEEDEEVGGE